MINAIGGIVKNLTGVIDELHTSKEEMAKMDVARIEAISKVDLAQAEINKEQLSHPSFFIAGVRPAIMWICAVALFVQFILYPIVELISAVFGVIITIPKIDYQPLFTLVMGMLGLGAYRSYDKIKGTDTRKIRNKINAMNYKELNEYSKKWLR